MMILVKYSEMSVLNTATATTTILEQASSRLSVKRLPMALMDTVGSCEGYNLRLFCASGGAVTADTPEELAGICRELLYDPKALSDMSAALGRRENSADQVCRRLLSAMGERGRA